MSLIYVVVEGMHDAIILKHLLPDEMTRTIEFVIGRGSYSAQSLARTLLSTRNRPVVLVLDADTTDTQAVNEKRTFLLQLFRPSSGMARFDVVIAVPTIEGVLFHEKTVAERLLQREISPIEWALVQSQPKHYVDIVYETQGIDLPALLQRLNADDIKQLRNHPVIQHLVEFVAQETQPIVTA